MPGNGQVTLRGDRGSESEGFGDDCQFFSKIKDVSFVPERSAVYLVPVLVSLVIYVGLSIQIFVVLQVVKAALNMTACYRMLISYHKLFIKYFQ